ncbi:hypothetical protein JHK87_002047 [Glycine soja]|nr:hypothetical protein JHK87_002047 [Glycine soja]
MNAIFMSNDGPHMSADFIFHQRLTAKGTDGDSNFGTQRQWGFSRSDGGSKGLRPKPKDKGNLVGFVSGQLGFDGPLEERSKQTRYLCLCLGNA